MLLTAFAILAPRHALLEASCVVPAQLTLPQAAQDAKTDTSNHHKVPTSASSAQAAARLDSI